MENDFEMQGKQIRISSFGFRMVRLRSPPVSDFTRPTEPARMIRSGGLSFGQGF
ncbi:MAG: hypothetical protein Q8K98_13630 [Bacteroidota bacterium]|nr:hypothetical protein [Bacteroidota bacterium]